MNHLFLVLLSSAKIAVICSLGSFNFLNSARLQKDDWVKKLSSKMQDGMQNLSTKNSARRSSTPKDLIDIIEQGHIPKNERKYIINGWRWHTMSVMRDLDRFSSVLSKLSTQTEDISLEDRKRLHSCYEFVCNFNWRALMKVEREIFFPWLSDLLPSSAKPLMNDIIAQHSTIVNKAAEIGSICTLISTDNIEPQQVRASVHSIDAILKDLIHCAQKIRNAQEDIFVPYIAAYCNKQQQTVFNNRVISQLGLLDSQVHIVSMFEAIKDDKDEMILFKEEIPRVARGLIPIWKSRLYDPKTRALY